MRFTITPVALAVALAATALAFGPAVPAQPAQSSAPEPMMSKAPHRVVIQISQDDAAVMNTALNNAENLTRYFKDKGETVEIEFVAYGPGLSMFRSDTSPVKGRLALLHSTMTNVTFSGCGNTMATQSKAEGKAISLLPEAQEVPTGIARIVELEEAGYTYVRP
jgi:uncharacterized protein